MITNPVIIALTAEEARELSEGLKELRMVLQTQTRLRGLSPAALKVLNMDVAFDD